VEIANQKAWGQIRAKKVREGSNFQVVDGRTRIGGGVAGTLAQGRDTFELKDET
jgi:hypothetical protein